MNKKNITLRILIGLPGSGKTCFAKSLEANKPNDVLVFGENELQDTDFRIYKKDTGKRFPPMNSDELRWLINNYSGSRFKTLVMDGLFLTTERILEVIQLISAQFTPQKIILDYWPENREECLRNDYLRRRTGSSLSIESLSINVDFNAVKATYPNASVEIHSVYHTPDWVIFFRQYLTVTDERELYSEKWTTGGEYRSFDGCRFPVSPDEVPSAFRELDELLEKICPSLSYLEYKKIISDSVSTKETEEHDYYSCTIQQCFVCNLEILYEDLYQFGYIAPTSVQPENMLLTEDELESIRTISAKEIKSMTPLERAAWKLYAKSAKPS